MTSTKSKSTFIKRPTPDTQTASAQRRHLLNILSFFFLLFDIWFSLHVLLHFISFRRLCYFYHSSPSSSAFFVVFFLLACCLVGSLCRLAKITLCASHVSGLSIRKGPAMSQRLKCRDANSNCKAQTTARDRGRAWDGLTPQSNSKKERERIGQRQTVSWTKGT